jgi:Ca2+-binding RTX toxin-like protein
VTGALLAASAAAPTTAGAAGTCSFNAGAAVVNANITTGTSTIARNAAGAITFDGIACSTATVANTDTIKVTNPGTATSQTAVISLGGGALGPGKTAEPSGAPEIEVQVNLGPEADQLVLSGSGGADAVRVGSLGANLNGDDDGDVTWSGIDSSLEVRGLAGNDTLSGAGGIGTGGAPSKTLTLLGGAGDDALTGGAGFDVLWGDADTVGGVAAAPGNDTLAGGAAGDELHGQTGNDTLDGQAGNDRLFLDAGTDTMRAGDGADSFESEGFSSAVDGADIISGGRGTDSLDLTSRTQNLVITLDNKANDGADTALPAGTADEGDNVQADVEELFLGSGDDNVSADKGPANAAFAANFIAGGAGADVLAGGEGDDGLTGDAGNDTLRGGFGDDDLDGLENDDSLFGGDGDDDLDAGSGSDTTSGDAGDDYMWQQAFAEGADSIAGGAGVDTADYSSRAAHVRLVLDNFKSATPGLKGNDGADANGDGVAEEGDDVRADVEVLWGGLGNDLLSANTSAANSAGAENQLQGGFGNDTLLGGHADDFLAGGAGGDELTGGNGEDTMEGDAGPDRFLAADQFFDVIHGGLDADIDVIVNKDGFDSVTAVP